MPFVEQFVRRPQSLWLRKAIFQIHLWVGIAMGFYVVAISVSGSALFFRSIANANAGKRVIVAGSGPLLTNEQLMAAAKRAYPEYTPQKVWPVRRPGQEVEILMMRGDSRKSRLFDPYTGQVRGPAVTYTLQVISFMMDLHVNLLAGPTGRIVNGIAGALLTLLGLTGAVLWWPGIQNWRRSLTINPRTGWKRINWDLHSAVGFWTFGFFLMWSFTGVYLVFPAPFDRTINRFAPLDYYFLGEKAPEPAQFIRVADRPFRRPKPHYSNGDMVIRTMFGMHFGNFAGLGIRITWALLGLTQVILFVTGFLMWWNRVLRK